MRRACTADATHVTRSRSCNTTQASRGTRRVHAASAPSPGDAVWPAAFAVLLVANLASPTSARTLPRGTIRAVDCAEVGTVPPRSPCIETGHSPAPSGVISIRPLEAPAIKSDYTLAEFLDVIAASAHPFRHTGDSLVQMYASLTGHSVAPDTRRTIGEWAQALDFATGLIPDIRLTRMPGDAAAMAADAMEGRAPQTERIVQWMQSADVRGGASAGIVRARPNFASVFRQRQLDARRQLVALRQDGPDIAPAHASEVARDVPSPFAQSRHGWTIEGEQEHLQGYAQSLPYDRLPAGEDRRLLLVDGKHYLRGDAGFYHATRGLSTDHWLVVAPRGSGHVAQVPVHYDAPTGRWRAEAPLRLCGGGCAPSRAATPDSIVHDEEKILEATAHLRDEHTRDGIRHAFDDLSLLHLTRSNRPDLNMMRDNSIVNHRAALRASMKHIKRNLPLIRQQEEASMITTLYYYWNRYTEAFCQENSEILFHYLLANGIPAERLRMITVQPRNRPPHVLVLYTESERLVALLEAATPQPPSNARPDGITDTVFAREVYESRDSTILLDPWSHSRATSFVRTNHAVEMVDALDAAFADIGHRPGHGYRVSITRPLDSRRASVSSLASAGSGGNSGNSGNGSRSGSGATSGRSSLFGSVSSDVE
uniref:Uncharacterized protein n=1 Tax=Pandoraea faecigallinarum TaxID=656179 RepID=A0A0H3WTA6_9BURK